MYAIIRTGGKQYRVQAGDVVRVEHLEAAVGSKVTLDEVLFLGDETGPTGHSRDVLSRSDMRASPAPSYRTTTE